MVTHDTRLAKKVGDKVVFLEDGRAVFFNSVDELIASTDPLIQEFMREDAIHSTQD